MKTQAQTINATIETIKIEKDEFANMIGEHHESDYYIAKVTSNVNPEFTWSAEGETEKDAIKNAIKHYGEMAALEESRKY